MRDGASWGKAFFGDFVKKIQKNFTKIGLVWVPIGQFRNFFAWVDSRPSRSFWANEQENQCTAVIDGLHPRYTTSKLKVAKNGPK